MLSKIYELGAPKNLYLREEIIDENSLGIDEIIAETIYSAISPGTEVAAYNGSNPLRPGKVYPRVLGYCNIAKILAKGSKVIGFEIGDYIFTHQSHRTFFKCNQNDIVIKIDEGIDLKHAATSYLYHLGYHSLLSSDAKAGHNIGIIGAGTLGYTTCVMSRLIGAKTFVFSNQKYLKDRLKAQSIFCFNKSVEAIVEIESITHNVGLDIIINTSNNWDDWLLALQIVNKGGTILNLGFPGREEPLPPYNPLDPKYVYVKNIVIKPLCYLNELDIPHYDFRFTVKRNILYILDLIKEKILNPNHLISDEIHYSSLHHQYEKYLNKDRSMFTTIINWK